MEHLYGPSVYGLQDVLRITCDRTGTLYGIHGSSSSSPGLIVSYDLRQNLLSEDQGLGRSVLPVPASQPSQIIRTSPPLSFEVHSITVAPSGRYLAVSGYDREDNDRLVITVVDVHGGKAVAAQQAGDVLIAGDAGEEQQQLRHRLCMAYNVDYQLFASRPGLKQLQVSWHPHSDAHLVVLTNDNRLRIYSLSDLSAAQLTLHVKLSNQSREGRRYGVLQHARTALDQACSFAFGPAAGWGFFTLFIAGTSGHTFGLCPVAPPGMRVPSSALQQCAQEAGSASEAGVQGAEPGGLGGGVEAWLQAAFGVQDLEELEQVQGRLEVSPHVLPEHSVACQGPLNSGQDSVAPSTQVVTSITAVHHLSPASPSSSSSSSPEDGLLQVPDLGRLTCTSALLTSTAQGTVWAHALSAQLLPAWAPVSPQCVLGVGGEVSAVRCECEVVPPPPSIKAILVDKIVLPLTVPSTTGGPSGTALPPTPPPAMGRLTPAVTPAPRSSTPSPIPGRLGVLLGSDDTDDDEGDEVEDEGARGASRVSSQHGKGLALVLLAEDMETGAAAAAGGGAGGGRQILKAAGYPVVWATHASGCWALGLAWLPSLAAASSRAVGVSTLGTAVAAAAGEGSLPPVVPHELWAPEAAQGVPTEPGPCATSSALLQDVFFGTHVLLLVQGENQAVEEEATAHGVALLCCRHRPTALPAASEQGDRSASAGAGPGGTAAAGAADALTSMPASASGGAGAADAAVEASIQALYGDLLCSPPYSDAVPRGKGNLLVSTPEGAAALTAAIRSLRQGPVEGAHAAHQALRLRAAQLAVEASSHAAAVEELQGHKSELQARQAALTDRLLKAVQLHQNLSERTALLAQLHWSLPRPLSDAERQLSSDLDVLVARRDTMGATWEALRRRADLMVEQRSAALATGQQQSTPQQPEHRGSRAGGAGATPQRSGLGAPVSGLMSRPTTPGTAAGMKRGLAWSGISGTPSRVLAATPVGRTPQQPTATTGGAGLPPTQLSKVHAMLLEHLQQTTRCASQVGALEREVQGWAAAQDQQQVEQELQAAGK